jgi:hypothetical protein
MPNRAFHEKYSGGEETMTDVWFHVTVRRVDAFTGSDGFEVPCLIAGDTYRMPEWDALRLQDGGAGYIRYDPPSDVATFQRASTFSILTDGMEDETEAINKLDREAIRDEH